LADGPDWWLTACLDWPRDRWLGYVLGYWKAADLIASHVAETGRDQDTLIYPFLMCWRHYVELQLKLLLTLLARWLREPRPLPRTHKIEHLWRVTRPMLERAYPGDETGAIDNAERILLQLHALDPTSEDARYPIRVDGSPTLTALSRVHIRQFHAAMAGVAHFLDASDCGLRVKLDERTEYEADMATWYPPEL